MEKMIIDSIALFSKSKEVSIKGQVQKGNLYYNTEIQIHENQLNKVINALQVCNADLEVASLFSSNQLGDELLYLLEGSKLVDSSLNLSCIYDQKEMICIRA